MKTMLGRESWMGVGAGPGEGWGGVGGVGGAGEGQVQTGWPQLGHGTEG